MEDNSNDDIVINISADDTSLQKSLVDIPKQAKDAFATMAREIANSTNLVFKISEEASIKAAKALESQIASANKMQAYNNQIRAKMLSDEKSAEKESEKIYKQLEDYHSQIRKSMETTQANSEKEMVRLHSEALRENLQRDKEYFTSLIAQQKEAQATQIALSKDAEKQNDAYLRSLGVAGGKGGGTSSSSSSGFGSGFLGGAIGSRFLSSAAPVYAGYKAYTAIKDSIETSDKIRDTDAAIKAYSKSAEEATKVIEFFNKTEDQTRLTSLELKKIFVDILPRSQQAGISTQTTESVTIALANLAQFRKVSADSLESAYTNIVGGTGNNLRNNSLLKALRITTDQIKEAKANGTDLIEFINNKILEFGKKAGALGGTVSSIWEQTKFDMMNSFSEGWNYARGASTKGMSDLKTMINDPVFKGLLQTIGTTMAVTVQVITTSIGNFFSILKIAVSDINGGIHTVLAGLGTAIEWIEKLLSKIPGAGSLAKQIGGIAGDFSKINANDAAKYFQQSDDEAAKMAKRSDDLLSTFRNVFSGKGVPQGDYSKPLDTGDDNTGGGGPTKYDKARELLKKYIDSATSEYEILKNKVEEVNQTETKASVGKAFATYAVDAAIAAQKYEKALTSLDKAFKLLTNSDPLVKQAILSAVGVYAESIRIAQQKLQNVGDNLTEQLDNAGSDWFTDSTKKAGKTAQMNTRLIYDQQLKDERDFAREYAKQLKEEIKAQNVFDDAVTNMVSSLIEGGKGLSKSLEGTFKKLISSGLSDLLGNFRQQVLGITDKEVVDPSDPSKSYTVYTNTRTGKSGRSVAEASIGDNRSTFINTGMVGLSSGLNGYNSGLQNQAGGRTSSIISGAIAGIPEAAATGGLSVVIGALAGLLGNMIGQNQARADYKYGVANISNGNASFTQTKNINPDDVKKMNASIQDAFDTSWNGWMTLLTKYSSTLIPKLASINGKFQDNPSAHFLDNFQTWLTRTLPDAIQKQFADGMESVAKNLGMTGDKFQALWKKFSVLDPTKQAEIWTTIFATLDNFNKVRDFYGLVTPTLGGPTGGRRRSVVSDVSTMSVPDWASRSNVLRGEMSQTFAQDLHNSDKDIISIGASISHLTGQAQVNAAKQLSDLTVQRYEKEKQYMKDLITLQDSVHHDVKQMIADLTAEGMKDSQGQTDYKAIANFYQGRANDDLIRMTKATNPTELNQAWQDYLSDVQKVKDAQAQLGPENAEEVRKWVINALNIGQSYFDAKIKGFGDDLTQVDTYFRDNVKPFIDKFTGDVTDVNGGLNDVNGSLGDFGNSVDNSTDKLNTVFAPAIVATSAALDDFTAKLIAFNGDGSNSNSNDPFYQISYYGYGK